MPSACRYSTPDSDGSTSQDSGFHSESVRSERDDTPFDTIDPDNSSMGTLALGQNTTPAAKLTVYSASEVFVSRSSVTETVSPSVVVPGCPTSSSTLGISTRGERHCALAASARCLPSTLKDAEPSKRGVAKNSGRAGSGDHPPGCSNVNDADSAAVSIVPVAVAKKPSSPPIRMPPLAVTTMSGMPQGTSSRDSSSDS